MIMENFIKKSDTNIVEERIEIAKNKLSFKKLDSFLSDEENIRSYVRLQYLLGEPCWGNCSPVSDFSSRILYKIKNPLI